MLNLFAACAPGLEPWLARELDSLGIGGGVAEPGGVAFSDTPSGMARVCLHSGLANHLLLRVADPFDVRRFDKLVRKTAALPWAELLPPQARVRVRAVCRKSRLYHSEAVAQRVAAGIAKAIGDAAADGPELGVAVRVVRDRCSISLDVSGEALHRRGWRQQTGKAPLREDLARALLVSSGWTPQRPLLDPLMGSGTILIEAATMARKLAPGRQRRFAFEDTRLLGASEIEAQRVAADRASLAGAGAAIVGLDHMDGALRATLGNAERAGVREDLEVGVGALGQAPWPEHERGMVVTNPPYGLRVGNAEALLDLYAELGRRTRERGWGLGAVISDRRFVRALNVSAEPRLSTSHGGLDVQFYSTARS